jgi:predicted kinase
MQAVIFCGIPGAGKTTFYRERFFDTHVRISRDMLRTARREELLMRACLEGLQPFVVDNTNVTRDARARYIAPALAARFEVVGYFFDVEPRHAFERNRRREGKAAVPAAGLFGAQKRLQPPTLDEGFTAIHRVVLVEATGFEVTGWPPS